MIVLVTFIPPRLGSTPYLHMALWLWSTSTLDCDHFLPPHLPRVMLSPPARRFTCPSLTSTALVQLPVWITTFLSLESPRAVTLWFLSFLPAPAHCPHPSSLVPANPHPGTTFPEVDEFWSPALTQPTYVRNSITFKTWRLSFSSVHLPWNLKLWLACLSMKGCLSFLASTWL